MNPAETHIRLYAPDALLIVDPPDHGPWYVTLGQQDTAQLLAALTIAHEQSGKYAAHALTIDLRSGDHYLTLNVVLGFVHVTVDGTHTYTLPLPDRQRMQLIADLHILLIHQTVA